MQTGEPFGPYRLVSLLGRGGMGEVWEAVLHGPRGFERHVALKLLSSNAAPNATDQPSDRVDQREGLLREARLGGLLAHPNVVGIQDVGESDGRLFVAMDLVRGVPATALLSEGALPPLALAQIGVQVARGLHHCHELEIDGVRAGLVHRDIKPRNMLVDWNGVVRIADLGIARLSVATDTREDGFDIAGTLGFMPPEQGLGIEDHRADIFALGVSLVMLGTLQLPFGPVLLTEDLVAAGLEGDPAWLAVLEQRAPGMGAIARRCLSPDPADRFPTAHRLAEALAALRLPGDDLGVVLERYLSRREGARSPANTARQGVTHQGAAHQEAAQDAAHTMPTCQLPPLSDRFVGREDERSAIIERVHADDSLIVLAGPGGIGKTRVAIETANALAAEMPGGVWFCDLSSARTEGDLCTGIARALGISITPDPSAAFGRVFAAKGRCLLVLDAIEHVHKPAIHLLRHLLTAAPQLVLFATSRVALRITEERLLTLGPLGLEPAIALFTARCPVGIDEDIDLVRDIVASLDGLPLAIEMAAASCRRQSLSELHIRLHRALAAPALAAPALAAPALSELALADPGEVDVDRALRASFDGSAELLGRWERSALAQWTVFAGAFSLDAANAVLDRRDWDIGAPSAVSILATLVDHSVVRTEGDGRFQVIPVLRAIAAEMRALELRRGDELRHAAWFNQYGHEDALARIHQRGGELFRHELRDILDDLVAAVFRTGAPGAALAAWAVLGERGPIERGLEVLQSAIEAGGSRRKSELQVALAEALMLIGRHERADQALETPLCVLAEHDPTRLRAVGVRAALYRIAHRFSEAESLLIDALGKAQHRGDTTSISMFHSLLGSIYQRNNDPERALVHLEASISERVASGNLRGEINTRTFLALVLRELHRPEEARKQLERVRIVARSIGLTSIEARSLGILGVLSIEREDLALAEEQLAAALLLHQEVGEVRSVAAACGNLAIIARLHGDLPRAILYAEESVRHHRSGGDLLFLGHALSGLANVLRDAGRPLEALARYDEAMTHYRTLSASLDAAQCLRNAARCSRILGDVEDEIARLEAAIGYSAAVDPSSSGMRVRTRAELVIAYVLAGHFDRAKQGLQRAELEMCETDDAYAKAVAHLARAILRPPDDMRALDDLDEAIALLESLREPVVLAGCWLERAARQSGAASASDLARAEALIGERPVIEALRLLLLRARLEPERVHELDEAIEKRARALGVPTSADLRLVMGEPPLRITSADRQP